MTHATDPNIPVIEIRPSKKIVNVVKETKDAVHDMQYYEKELNMVHDMQSYEGTANGDHPNEGAQFSPTYDNPLHKFASYSTIFTLSGVHSEELNSLAYLDGTPHDIIARSGGIGDPHVSDKRYHERKEDEALRKKYAYRHGETMNEKYDMEPSFNILSAGHDIFFEDVNILSTVGPNPERGLANFTKMEFQLHEPFGITLVEKIRTACWVNDFDDYQDAPLLLTIEWKGWDEHGKPQIINDKTLTRKIPILISRVQFDVDEGGARYNIIAVPYGDLAHDDRFKFPRTIFTISATKMSGSVTRFHAQSPSPNKMVTTPIGWVDQMEDALKKQMEDEVKENVRQLHDTYRFIVHPKVTKYGNDWLKDLQLRHYEEHAKWYRVNDGVPKVKINNSQATIDVGTALPKFFEDAIRTLVGYQQLAERFWYTWASNRLKEAGAEDYKSAEATIKYFKSDKFQEDLPKNQYVDWFMIKSSVYTDTDRFDHIRKVSPKEITYFAIPTKIHILKFIKPGVSFGNIDWDKYVKKQYDYIYTGNNIDVQTLKIDYKSAYYMRNVRPYWNTKVYRGEYEKFVEGFDRVMKSVFGKEKYPEINLPLRQEPSHIKGRSTVSTSSPTTHKSQEFYDYLTNPQADMMKIELEILGDPQYICQDIYTTLRKDGDNIYPVSSKGIYNGKWGSFNAEQYQPLVKVNYRLPDEIDVKDQGLMFEKQVSYSENLFFNGVYQVTKVESRVNQGAFTQVLSLVRLNNQKGSGQTALTTSFSKLVKEDIEKKKEEEKRKENLITAVDTMGSSSGIKAEDYIDAIKDKWL